jgi:NADH:ubiquinone oxidoreductase subunit 2 (subunit N)
MENLTFVQNVIIFIALNAAALLAINIKKNGKYIAFGLSLVSAVTFFAMLYSRDKFNLGELFTLDGNKVFLLKIVSILNILMILINGYQSIEKVKSTLLVSYMFLGGVFLLGANELITFYVALETIALVG